MLKVSPSIDSDGKIEVYLERGIYSLSLTFENVSGLDEMIGKLQETSDVAKATSKAGILPDGSYTVNEDGNIESD